MVLNDLFFYWIIVAFLFLIFEIGHPGLFFFLSFSLGAVAAALVSLASNSATLQSSIFLGGTVVALIILRTWVAKQGAVPRTSHRTNIDALQGKRGIATSLINPLIIGSVKIGGEVWSAKSVDEIEKGDVVEVVSIHGAHVVVKKTST